MTTSNASRGLALRALSLGIAAALAAPVASAQNMPGTMTSNTNVTAPVINGNTMTVDVTGPRAYAEWDTFDLSNGFTFQVTNSTTPGNYIFVNRVTGGLPTDIFGQVLANGNLWLLNPAGIVVGSGAAFDVGGLLLSTATLLDGEDETTDGAAFLANGSTSFTLGGASGIITVQPGAQVTANTGAISMISNAIVNGGVLNAGSGEVALVGAQDVSIAFDADLNAFTTLAINAASNQGTAVRVGGNSQFTGSRTIIAAAGVADGQGNILLVDDNAADNIAFVDGDVVLYAARNGGGTVLSGGAVQAIGSFDADEARIQAIGRISTPDNLQLAAAGGVGSGAVDLDLSTVGTMSIENPVRGRDVALNAGGRVTLTSGDARDDFVIRSNGITATGALRSGVAVDALGVVDEAGAGDALNGPTLSRNDMSLYGENGTVDLALAPLAGDDYRVRGTDFLGAALSPTWVGGGFENTFVIMDTAGGFTAGNLTSPGRLWIEVRNGGGLNVVGPLLSDNGDIQLITTGGGDITLSGNVTSGDGSGSANEYVVLNSSGAINQTAGIIDTTRFAPGGSLHVRAVNGISLLGANRFGNGAFQNSGAGAIRVRNASGTSGSSAFNLTTVDVADGFNPSIAGATTGSGDIELIADNGMLVNGVPVSTGAGSISVTGATTVAGSTVFTATGGAAAFNGSIDGAAAGQGDLVVTSATGTSFNGDVGATSALSSITVNGASTINSGAVRATNAIDLDDVTTGAGAPATVTIESTGGSLTTGAVTASHAGTFVARGTSINLGAFAGPNASLDLVASAGAIAAGPVDAGGMVSMTATGSIGGATPGSRADVTAAGQVTIDTDGTALLGAVESTGAGVAVLSNGLDATSIDAAGILSLNGGTGGIMLGSGSGSSTSLNTSGAVNVTGPLTTGLLVGSAGGGATLGGANRIEELGNFTASSLVLNNARALNISGTVDTGAGDASIAVTGGNLGIASTGQVRGAGVDLSTDAGFVNASGSDAVVASNRWVIYSAAPTGNAFDNLDSGNTAFWGATRSTLSPGTVDSNRYVFAFQPTLTFTTTDITKVYGTDLTANPGVAYTITGYQPGVSGAFLGDSAATVFTGTPRLTSDGFAPRASVNGGPYAITIDSGSLASNNGYAFDFSNAGQVTVTPLAITGTGVPDDKTYDGTTDATGSIILDGVLTGDEVGASGQFAFGTPNAGTGLTVTLTGVALNGADAGNYTVTVTGVELADILRRSLTVTANPLTKPEGGTDPALTWTITDGSLVNGDSLTGSLSREPGEAPGIYDILQGSLDAGSNYELTFVGSTLTITQVPVDPVPQPGLMFTTSNDPTELLDTLGSPLADGAADPLQVVDQRVYCENDARPGAECPRTQPE